MGLALNGSTSSLGLFGTYCSVDEIPASIIVSVEQLERGIFAHATQHLDMILHQNS